jgi:inhibitor of cysteine peptidase
MDKRQITGTLIIAVSVILFFVLFFAIKGTENDKIIETVVGKSFTITLDSNPTTGYQWQIVKALDTGLMELIDSEFIAPKTDLVGAPGKENWHFKAIKSGKAIISFEYVRPWEKDELPVQVESFIIIIRN